MIIFLCDRWVQVKELPGKPELQFIWPVDFRLGGYLQLWRDTDLASAPKILPYAGHEFGIYEGCVLTEFDRSKPPYAWKIVYKKKIVQKIK